VRTVAAVGTCLLAVALLTGCEDPGRLAPLSISRDGDTLLVAVCADISATSVTVSERDPNEDWRDIFVASGQAIFRPGDVLRVPDGYAGLVSSKTSNARFNKASLLAVSLDASEADKSILGSFHGLSTLKAGSWTSPTGVVSPYPCKA